MIKSHKLIAGALVALAMVGATVGVQAQALRGQVASMANAPSTKNPFTGKPEAVEEGRQTYNATCLACHGINGSNGEFAPGLAVAGRFYTNRSDVQIFNVIKNGVAGTAMPPHAGKLTDDQIWKITAYIYGLRGTAIDAPTPGDVAHGEQVFFGKGQCSTCHMANGKGSIRGPDLTGVANRMRTPAIVASLTTDTGRTLPPGGYQSYQLTPLQTWPMATVVTADGKTIKGLVRNEDSYSMQILGNDEQLHLLQRSKLKSVTYDPKRVMPSDYDKRLTKAEFDDMLAYVTRLGKPNAAPLTVGGRGGDE
jgi:putative heme-binding domain-containing protein